MKKSTIQRARKLDAAEIAEFFRRQRATDFLSMSAKKGYIATPAGFRKGSPITL